jgi:hypothetical protein
MRARKIIAGLALALLTAISAGARAERPGQFNRCSLSGKYQARAAQAYVSTEDAGYTTIRTFRGAEMFVPAQPGLTKEWLQRVLTEQIASGDCNFGVSDVSVNVLSAGGGFSVRITGRDERAAGEILRNAEHMLQ